MRHSNVSFEQCFHVAVFKLLKKVVLTFWSQDKTYIEQYHIWCCHNKKREISYIPSQSLSEAATRKCCRAHRGIDRLINGDIIYVIDYI